VSEIVCLGGRRTSLLVTNHPLKALLRTPAQEAGAPELEAAYLAGRGRSPSPCFRLLARSSHAIFRRDLFRLFPSWPTMQ
jgi:hypothetical protein